MKNIIYFLLSFSLVSVVHAMKNTIPDDATINAHVARAPSYEAFKTNMEPYGGLKQVASSGNFHETDWSRFKAAIASTPLESRASAPIGAYFSSSLEAGYIDVVLNNQKSRK